MNKEFFFHPKT